LVIHNEKDFRVPLSEGMQAFNAAQLQGVPSKFLYFPDEGHWVTKPQNAALWAREFYEFLDQYLK
jgi:dipeptidyl aminopeptidase/acylaminoacyl peptidase